MRLQYGGGEAERYRRGERAARAASQRPSSLKGCSQGLRSFARLSVLSFEKANCLLLVNFIKSARGKESRDPGGLAWHLHEKAYKAE